MQMESAKAKELLLEFKDKLKLFKSIAKEKQTAIIEFDHDRLEDIIGQEELLLEEISELEKKFISDFGRNNLKTLIEDNVELKMLRTDLEREIEEVKKLSAENKYLISHSLVFVRKLIELYGGENKINVKV
jgi:flagellar biosynthesis/type III secretory pathway chaperone